MSELELPPEVTLCILDHITPPDAAYADLELGQATFNSLSLVSSTVKELVRRVRYRQVLLRTPANALALVNHNDDSVHALVRQQTRSVTFGDARGHTPARIGMKPHPNAFSEFLAVFGAGIRRVSLAGYRLTDPFLWAIRRGELASSPLLNTMLP